jgi:two-component system, NarL family, sensor histidine kinase YdfH
VSDRTVPAAGGLGTLRDVTTGYALRRRTALPFYAFISLLLAGIGALAARDVVAVGHHGRAVVAALLVAAHVGLYWVRYAVARRNAPWWFFYYPAQAILTTSVVLVVNGLSPFEDSFIYTATVCMAAEAIGVWGNAPRALLIGALSIAQLVLVETVLTRRATVLGVLSTFGANGVVILLFVVVLNQQLAERQKAVDLAESQESANARLAATAAEIEALTLKNERQRMARELHDTLVQGVAGHVLQLEALKAHLAANRTGRAAEIVEQAIRRARSTLAESRAAIGDLRALPPDVGDALRRTVEHFQVSSGIPCELDLEVGEHQLSSGTTDHAVSIARESLANVLRHASATAASVRLAIQRETLVLEIRDNGKGFDVDGPRANGHYGLVGMQERARLSGGTLVVESGAGGTRVRFTIGGPS